jgi:metalloendopeptidase OMA1, mitochondrial
MFATASLRLPLRTAARFFSTASRSQAPLNLQRLPITRPLVPFRPWPTARHFHHSPRTHRQAFNYQRFQQSASLYRRWRAQPTFRYQIAGIGGVALGFYVYNLEEVPVSGRRRFNVVSPETEQQLGMAMYEQTKREFGRQIMSPHSREHRQVQRVLDRLVPHSGLENEKWEIHVIDDDMKNAFVIPGGKVFVFRGILDICEGDDGLAAVLGHEIAHNVAHHAAERSSRAFPLLFVGLVGFLVFGVDPGITNLLTNVIFAWPGSRKEEAEADYIGLLMMAESCYDPQAAVGLWARMEKAEQGAPPQFLSTHPSSHNRMEQIRDWLPQAEVKRESSDCGMVTGFADDFRRTFQTQRW